MQNPYSPSPASGHLQSSRLRRLLVGLAAVVAGLCVGVAAGAVQGAGISLLVLQSIAAGIAAGVVLIGLAAGLGLPKPGWLAAMVASLVAVATQHVWLYSAVMNNRQRAANRQPGIEMFRPGWSEQSFVQYITAEANSQAIALWTLDACLLVLAAVVIVEWSRRRTTNEQQSTVLSL